jgi:phosphopantetheine adenylyltransferase
MRLIDLFEEFGSAKIDSDMEATLPPVLIMPELDNSNSYKQYRFMSDMAAARAVAAGEVPFRKIVPWSQYLTVVGYTPEEMETVRLAGEQANMRVELINPSTSREPSWINTKSTVMPFHMSEHKRSNAKLAGLFESEGMQVLVIYPGRFQPLHRGHQAVFQKLQEEYGDNVYIATSDKTDGEHSPFNYHDKTVMARAADIPLDKVVQVKSPYSPSEITKLFDPNNTVLIFVVGVKDMEIDPRFKFEDKKDGTKSYLQKFKDEEVAEPMSKHGYIMSAPTVEFELLGAPITSATQVRKLYAASDDVKRDKILKDLYGNSSSEIRTMFDRKLGSTSSQLSESAQSDTFVDNMRKFFAIAQRDLELDHLPKIVWTSASTAKGERPTFGKFQNDTNTITVSIINRHPIDIMRTLAHELTHYKQQLTKGLDADSGDTGSPEEDEANAVAGQIMRHFDEENPAAFDVKPVVAESDVWDHPNPVKKHKALSPADKAAAKRRAKSAGRKYPNMVDNIWAARR